MIRMLSICCCIFACLQTLSANADENEIVSRIVKYFPGPWEIKSDDGKLLGSVDWSTVSGGVSIAGPGTSDGLPTYHLAGWEPSKKLWLHTMHRKDGQHLRLELDRFKGDTYFGTTWLVEADGSVTEAKWENKVIDENHFAITTRSGGKATVTHWYRKTK
ncbi:hypothetical protein NZK35_05635 [Stieleria sp. ICT_E10.1]|uniref:hypothetical protein n=1 Tax=Stieleria sedimenti TaxID=2976331 RepID=UPI002180113B|nr:hypothetical protein [Stieleria sedimenti]MCS7466155.1 hypothetical protein [Stieleria sedimenti]